MPRLDPLDPLDPDQLDHITGGAESSFGRCGPGDGWKWLGDVRTPECAAHDQLVRDYQAAGSSKAMSHIKAAPALPAAIGSYVGVRAEQLGNAIRDRLK